MVALKLVREAALCAKGRNRRARACVDTCAHALPGNKANNGLARKPWRGNYTALRNPEETRPRRRHSMTRVIWRGGRGFCAVRYWAIINLRDAGMFWR